MGGLRQCAAGLGLAAVCLVAGQTYPAFADDSAAAAEIKGVIAAQSAAWNRGDIPGFMEGYWQSPELRFASGGGVTTGWQPTLERYLKRYDMPEKMGVLTFSDLDVDVLAEDAALVFGRWHLARPEAGDAGGLFTLTFRKIDGAWVVTQDHTSSGE